jgi:predicted nuclease of predicted toxin-antitoxin system
VKLLFDQNISFRLVQRLRDVYPAATQVRDLGLEDSTDREIWEYSKEHQYTIVTFDSDFYDFSLIWGHPPKIVWIRTGNKTTREMESILRKYQRSIELFLTDDELACLEIISS